MKKEESPMQVHADKLQHIEVILDKKRHKNEPKTKQEFGKMSKDSFLNL